MGILNVTPDSFSDGGQHNAPDAALLDIRMPVMDGVSMLRRIKANPKLASSPVIVISSILNDERRQELTERGVEYLVEKPVSPPLLADAIGAYESGDWHADALKATLEDVMTRYELKLGKAQAPVRVAVTGRTVGPPLFEALEVLGRDESLRRMRAALDRLGADGS